MRGFVIGIGLMSMFPLSLTAQQPDYTGSVVDAGGEMRRQSASMQGTNARVSIEVRDSTRLWLIKTIARQVGLEPTFIGGAKALDTRIHVALTNVPAIEAVQEVLKGSGLSAKVASDGVTLMIRPISNGNATVNDRVGEISGIVTDSATQTPLAGVTVAINGTKLTTLTGAKGQFSISKVPVGSRTLSFKLVGYRFLTRSVTVAAGKSVAINASLSATATALSEVVTTASGMQRRVEVPSDIVRIDADQIMARAPVQSVTDLIDAAQVPGVTITRGSGDPGAPSKIRIRGLRSMTASNDPAVIVDGNWIDATVGTPSGIDDIDPATIETVEIVRGPSASTLYGPGAANGVIVITTRKGRAGVTRWRTSYQRNWGQTYGTLPLSYAGFGYNVLAGTRLWCPIKEVIKGSCVQDSVAVYDPNNPLLKTDGVETSNRMIVGVEGGTPSTTYALTATATNTQGVRQMRPIDAIRYRILNVPVEKKFQRPLSEDNHTLMAALTLNPMPSLTIGMTVTGAQRDLPSNTLTGTFSGLGAGDQDYSLDTTQLWWSGDIQPIGRGSALAKNEASTRRSSILLGGRMDWRGPRGWIVSANAGINRSQSEESNFTRHIQCTGVTCKEALGSRKDYSGRQADLTGRFNVTKPLNLGLLSRILDLQPSWGGDFRKTESADMQISADSIPVGERSVVVGGRPSVSTYNATDAVAGYYLNLRVGLFRRLYFDLGGRQDIGSALKSLVNGTRYPKLGGSYLVSDESFWPQQLLINTLRLRAAMGYSAIQPDITDVQGRYTGRYMYVNGQWISGLQFSSAGNSVLRPERIMEMELGFDADLLNNRVNIVATYAQAENINALIIRDLPPSAGGLNTTRKENLGRVHNRNVEVTSEFTVVDSKAARLVVSHALTLRDNIVAKLGNKVTPFSNTAVGQIREGYPIAGVWVKQILGWRDRNRDGLLAQDEVMLGDSLAYAGWSQPRYEASYGINFTLLGRLMFDTRLSQRSQYVVSYTRKNKYGLEDVNAPLSVQADELSGSVNNHRSISDIRWNSASVTYFLPQRVLHIMKLREASVALQASNLALWTDYVGRDPAVNSNILTSERAYDDGNTTSQPRLFVLNFKIGL